MTDVTAAAERLRKHYDRYLSGAPEESPYYDVRCPDDWNMSKLEADRGAVMDAYLSEHPASDAGPITAERLEAMGFDDGSFPLPSAPRRPVTLYVECLCGELWRAKLDGVTGFVVLPTPLRTMGDVRKLLIGLGYSVTKEMA